jgi:hypothetical protein
MRNVVTQRGNLEQMCESLGLAATVQPTDHADATAVRQFKYWCGRNLEVARRELVHTQKLQRAELKPIAGMEHFIAAKEQSALKFCKRDAQGSPIYAQDPATGRTGMEILPEKNGDYRRELLELAKQFAGIVKDMDTNQRNADNVLHQDVTLKMFTIDFTGAPERMAGGLIADLRFMLDNVPEEAAPQNLMAARYFGTQAPDAKKPWYVRLNERLQVRKVQRAGA